MYLSYRGVLQPPVPGDPSNPIAGAGPNAVHPFRLNPLVAKYEEDFPLRKTGKKFDLKACMISCVQ